MSSQIFSHNALNLDRDTFYISEIHLPYNIWVIILRFKFNKISLNTWIKRVITKRSYLTLQICLVIESESNYIYCFSNASVMRIGYFNVSREKIIPLAKLLTMNEVLQLGKLFQQAYLISLEASERNWQIKLWFL